jgi:hypothetical protein
MVRYKQPLTVETTAIVSMENAPNLLQYYHQHYGRGYLPIEAAIVLRDTSARAQRIATAVRSMNTRVRDHSVMLPDAIQLLALAMRFSSLPTLPQYPVLRPIHPPL